MAQKPEIETVTMLDGRLVDFPGKRRIQKESFIRGGEIMVRMDFRNGESRLFTVPDSLLYKFAAHGAEQKLGDELSKLKTADGTEVSLDDCVLAIDELMDRLNAGDWNIKRDGGSMAGTSILLRALVEHTGKTPEQIRLFLSGDPSKGRQPKTHAEKLAMREDPNIKPIVQRLEAERAAGGKAAKVDVASLIGEIDDIE